MELEVDHNKMIEEIMHKIHEKYGVDGLREDEFTVSMYSALHGMDYKTAENELNKAIRDGAVEEVGREVRVDGRRIKHVFRETKP